MEVGKAQLANRRAREDAAARSLIRKVGASLYYGKAEVPGLESAFKYSYVGRRNTHSVLNLHYNMGQLVCDCPYQGPQIVSDMDYMRFVVLILYALVLIFECRTRWHVFRNKSRTRRTHST